jgi:hypothetical protein
MLSLWLNVFVLIAQLFMQVPALRPLAPTGSAPPFLISQTVVMIAFIALAVLSAKKFGGDNASPRNRRRYWVAAPPMGCACA